MNWTAGLARLTRVGQVMCFLGGVLFAMEFFSNFIGYGLAPLPLPVRFGVPLLFYGALLCIVSWVTQGFLSSTKADSPKR